MPASKLPRIWMTTVDHRLGQLAECYLAFRDQHERGDAGTRRIGCGRGRGVAGRGTDNGAAALFHCTGHGHGHATVLERTRRIKALVLDIQLDIPAGFARYIVQAYQRRIAFTETDHTRIRSDRQPVAVMFNQACITGCSRHTVNP